MKVQVYFFIGIDLYDFMNIGEKLAEHDDIARKSKILRALIKLYQDSITTLEKVGVIYTYIY